MRGCARGCLALTTLLLIVGAIGWVWGPDILRNLDHWRSPTADVEPTPELASGAIERFDRLMRGEVQSAEFSGAEIESAIRFEIPGYLPEGVTDPSVRLRDGEITIGLKVARQLIPSIPDLEGVRGFLPDTVPVQLRGSVITLDEGDAGFLVNRVEAAGIPIPSRFIPRIVAIINPGVQGDLPPELVRIPLPPGIRTVRVDGDRLILTGAD